MTTPPVDDFASFLQAYTANKNKPAASPTRDLKYHNDGKAFWVDTRTGTEEAAPQYDDETKAAGYRAPPAERAPPGGPSAPTVIQLQNASNPGSASATQEEQLRQSGYEMVRPGYWVRKEADGKLSAYEAHRAPDGSIGFDDVTGRDYSILNPKPDKLPASEAKINPATAAYAQSAAIGNLLNGTAGSPAQTSSQPQSAMDSLPPPPGAPASSGGNAGKVYGQEGYQLPGGYQHFADASGGLGADVKSNYGYDQYGTPSLASLEVPVPGTTGSRTITPYNAWETLRTAGYAPTNDFAKNAGAAAGIDAERAAGIQKYIAQGKTPDEAALLQQTAFDATNLSPNPYERGKLMAALPSIKYKETPDKFSPVTAADWANLVGFAGGGEVDVDPTQQQPKPDAMSAIDSLPTPAGASRSQQAGGYVPPGGPHTFSEAPDYHDLLTRYWGGGAEEDRPENISPQDWYTYLTTLPQGYGPRNDFLNGNKLLMHRGEREVSQAPLGPGDTLDRLANWDRFYPGQSYWHGSTLFAPSGGNALPGPNVRAPYQQFGGQQPYQGYTGFADGGSMMTDEPMIGVGMQTGQPRFMVGEAGPERLDITPTQPRSAIDSLPNPFPRARNPVPMIDPLRGLAMMRK